MTNQEAMEQAWKQHKADNPDLVEYPLEEKLYSEIFKAGYQAAAPQWISVDEFQKEANEGLCFICYKKRVVEAWHDHEQRFRFHKHSQNVYLTECITAVMPIYTPAPPAPTERESDD